MQKKIEKFVVVVEVPKLKTSDGNSLKIKGPKNDFYLYSEKIIDTLKEYNEDMKVLRIKSIIKQSFHSSGIDIEKNGECMTYIVSKIIFENLRVECQQ